MSTDGAADRARGGRRVRVVLPPQDPLLGSAGAVDSLSSGPVGDPGLVFLRHPIEVDVVVGERTLGGLRLVLLGEVELQVDGHLTA